MKSIVRGNINAMVDSDTVHRRSLACRLALLIGMGLSCLPSPAAAEIVGVVETSTLRMAISNDGRVVEFVDRQSGQNYVVGEGSPCASVRKAGQLLPATAVSVAEGNWQLRFADSGVEAVLRSMAQQRHVVWEVVSCSGEDVEEFVFCDVPLKLQGLPDEPFCCLCAGLNLKTNVAELPRPASRLRATCYPKFGCAGAAVAIVACPPAELRTALQEAVSAAPELPHSPLGGPWALDAPINRGSYLFNFDGITEENVDEWIALGEEPGNHPDRLPRRQLVSLRRFPAQSDAISAGACQSAGRD